MSDKSQEIKRLQDMIALCEKEARVPAEAAVSIRNNPYNNEALARAANWAIMAEEFRIQLNELLTE